MVFFWRFTGWGRFVSVPAIGWNRKCIGFFYFAGRGKKIGSELGYVFQGLQKAKKGIALEFAFSRACKKQIGFFIGNLIFVCLMGGWLDRNWQSLAVLLLMERLVRGFVFLRLEIVKQNFHQSPPQQDCFGGWGPSGLGLQVQRLHCQGHIPGPECDQKQLDGHHAGFG